MTATELTTAAEIDALAAALAEVAVPVPQPAFDTPLIFETGQDGRANRYVPQRRRRSRTAAGGALRDDLPLPDNTELDVVRHFTRLSQKTFGIDTGFYPLGSCTMKYNPRINDAMANLPALRDLHPFAPDELRKARSRSCGSSSAAWRRSSAWRRSRSTRRPARTPS
jgi:hypothetical protein